MKRLLAVVVLAVVAFAVGVLVGPQWAVNGRTHIVRRVSEYTRGYSDGGDTRGGKAAEGEAKVAIDSVHALGRIEPAGGLYAVGAPAGVRIDRLLVEVGQEVREGQDLAYVEGYSERKAQIAMIEAQLTEARAQSSAESEYETVLDQEATVEREGAEVLEEPEIKTQEANIGVLVEKSTISRRDYEHLVELKRDKRATVSAQEIERQYLVMRQDDAALNSARAELLKFKKGRETRRAKLDIQLKKAKVAARRTRLAIPTLSLEKQAELAREQLKQAVVRSPRAGRVLAILVKPGEAAGPRPILQLGDTRRMYVVAEVDEDEIPLVREGQKATVTNHAWNRSYSGVVESWALMVSKNDVLGLDPAAAAYARVVEIKVRLDEPCDDLRDRTHLQVNATIDVRPRATKEPKPEPASVSSR